MTERNPAEGKLKVAFEELLKEFKKSTTQEAKDILLTVLENVIPFCHHFNQDAAIVCAFPKEGHCMEHIEEVLIDFKERYYDFETVDCDDCGKTIRANEIYTDESGNTFCKECSPIR